MSAIEIKEISKIFSKNIKSRSITALDNVNLNVPEGIIFGLLGPNGAGKTTMIKILLGITHASSGDALILGAPISDYKIKNRIGYLPENHKFPPFLNGREVMEYSAKLSGFLGNNLDQRIDELLDLVNMKKWAKMKIKKYSKGMLQRIGLAQAMVNDPDLIFLDEPTDGVDPIGRKEIRDVMIRLKDEGKTIFLNSHLLSEVELVTDSIGILNKGKLVQEGKVAELTSSKEIYEFSIGIDAFSVDLSNFEGITKKTGNSFVVHLSGKDNLNKLIDHLRDKNIIINSIVPVKNSLEDLFIDLITETDKAGDK